jgi:hypothetical protein
LIEAVKGMPALKVSESGMVKDPSNSKINDFFPMAQEILVCQGPSLWRLHDHARQDFSGPVIGPLQRPLRDNKKQSQETDFHDPGAIRAHNSSKHRPQTHALDRAATGIGKVNDLLVYICVIESSHLSV